MLYKVKKVALAALAANSLVFSTSCGMKSSHSDQKVTNVVATPSKRQSIGNCWIYAQASWLESLLHKSQDKPLNVSETYWTYWDWFHKITDNPMRAPGETSTDSTGRKTFDFETGGSWSDAKSIILNYGFLYESEVAPEEENMEMSSRQADAETRIGTELTSGDLSSAANRADKRKVMAVLDRIFKVDMNSLVERGRANLSTQVAVGNKLDKTAPLSTAIEYWKEVSFDMGYGVTNSDNLSSKVKLRRKETLQKMMKALNNGQPVLMSFMVYFDALKIDLENRMGIFDYATLKDYQANYKVDPSRVGGHMVMLQDYSVTNVPNVGDLGFGDMSEDLKNQALEGELSMIKAKNSWGMTREERGLFDGSTVFDIKYLTYPTKHNKGPTSANLWDFVIPEYPASL